MNFTFFDPIQTGEGGAGGGSGLPARTLDVCDFFNRQAKATKLGDVSENLSGKNLPWQIREYLV